MLQSAVVNSNEKQAVLEWLGLEGRVYKESNLSFAYINLIKKGLKNKSVISFIKRSSLSKKQVSKIIHVSERTLQRNPPDKVMDIGVSERLVELARLFQKGIQVFNEKEKFIKWLNRPNKSLQNQSPLEIIETSIGIDLVMDELIKIEHGVFS